MYTTRAEIPDSYKWDLTAIYPDDEAWEVDFARVSPLLKALAAYEGKLANSGTDLAGALSAHEQASRLVDKL
jgi:oligoendopeptidase F